MLIYAVIVVILLLISSFSAPNQYWRTLTLSWLATLNLSILLAYVFYGSDVTPSFSESFVAGALCLALLAWSVALTPVQLLFRRSAGKPPSTHVHVLYEPTISPKDVRAE